MMVRLKQLLSRKSCNPQPKDLHQFMTQCSPQDKKAAYLEAAKRAVAEQRKVMEGGHSGHLIKT